MARNGLILLDILRVKPKCISFEDGPKQHWEIFGATKTYEGDDGGRGCTCIYGVFGDM